MKYLSKFSVFEKEIENVEYVDVTESLLNDVDVIKKHLNDIILKPYKSKIQSFTYSNDKKRGIAFTSTPFVGPSLGIFGVIITLCTVQVIFDLTSQTAKGPVKIVWKYNNGKHEEYIIGEYNIADTKITFIDTSGNKQSLGESEYAINSEGINVISGKNDTMKSLTKEIDNKDTEDNEETNDSNSDDADVELEL